VNGPWHRPLYENSQHSLQTNVHATGGIQNCSSNKRGATNPRLRPRVTTGIGVAWVRLIYIAANSVQAFALSNSFLLAKGDFTKYSAQSKAKDDTHDATEKVIRYHVFGCNF